MDTIFFAALLALACLALPGSFTYCGAGQIQEGCVEASRVRPEWRTLACMLSKDGMPADEITAILSADWMTFDPRVMPRKLTHNEKGLYYDRFLRKDRISRAKRFLVQHQELLQAVEGRYGVPKEIMVAIALVETDLGRYLGAGPAARILASMAVSDEMELVARWVPQDMRDAPEVRRRMRRKAKWAYVEFKELLRYCRENRLPLDIKGSIFGAIGICQFMPSNANKLGVDFDGDGRVDLFSMPDAFASMANYLVHHGWRPGLGRREKLKVILAYNHSTPYAETILKVADRLAASSSRTDGA